MRGGCRRHLERCRTRCALRVDDSHPAYAARTSCTQETPTAAAWTRGGLVARRRARANRARVIVSRRARGANRDVRQAQQLARVV